MRLSQAGTFHVIREPEWTVADASPRWLWEQTSLKVE
jgi:hypothetical protein